MRRQIDELTTSGSSTFVGSKMWTELPHPLDFDWRFNSATKFALWKQISLLATSGQAVALLGTPTIALAAKEYRVWPGPILLIDQNVPATSHADDSQNWIRADICEDELPDVRVEIVVADPPWYEWEMAAFLWSAAKMCRVEGHVLVCIPPIDTRPGVEEERIRLHDLARSFGLHLVGIRAAVLEYELPFFESNALRASGDTLSGPRQGDIAIYRRTSVVLAERPSKKRLTIWAERRIDDSRIRVRLKGLRKFGNPALRPLLSGDILPSVSRRDPRRVGADVWTSGNRIFRCEGADTLWIVLRAMAASENPEHAVESSLGRRVTLAERFQIRLAERRVRDVVKYESGELRAYRDSVRVHGGLGPRSVGAAALKRTG